jgi:hypothetical protein
MFRKTVRIACLVIGQLATAGLAYRALQDEDALEREQQAAVTAEAAVTHTAGLLHEVRASLHAYVAPGQGLPFWGKRAQETIGQLRESLADLEKIVGPTGGSLNDSFEAVNQVTAAERRVRTYVSRGEMHLAGDVIFTEIRDLVTTMTTQVESVRAGLTARHDRRAAALHEEQVMLAGGAIALWIAIASLFLPTEAKTAMKDPAEWRNELKATLNKQIPVAPEPPAAPAQPVVVDVPLPVVPLAEVQQLTEVCSDLSAVGDPVALDDALARVISLLNATGLIVWVASNDNGSLAPVATSGFDPKLVARIGRIPRDSHNLTAAAFRENTPKTSAATATTPGALAVPMSGPGGLAGVLSVELKSKQIVDDAKVALAGVVAAQLATLAMPTIEPTEESAIQPSSESSAEALGSEEAAQRHEPKRAAR